MSAALPLLPNAALSMTLPLSAGSRTAFRPRTPSRTSLIGMPAPEPMLSSAARQWPAGGGRVLQSKWDGFRLLVNVDAHQRVRAWSRHGTNLTDRLGPLPEVFADVPAASTFDVMPALEKWSP